MNQLYCICLNIKITTRQRIYDTDFTLRNDLQDLDHDLFQQKIAAVNDPEYHVEHSYLVHRKQVGEWTVHRCLNCGLDTHAVSTKPKSSTSLLSHMLERDHHVIDRLKQSADFSKVFQIVLQDHHGNSGPSNTSSGGQESLQSSLGAIQKQLGEFLMQEEAAMEERISQFEEEQRAQFQELQSKVEDDKKKMINVLLDAARDDTGQTYSRDSPRASQQSPASKDIPSPRKKPLSRTKSTPVHAMMSQRSFDADTDGMFLLDDDDTPADQPFYESDDEDDDTNSDASPLPYHGMTQRKAKLHYSSSVPISVPTWGSMATRDAEDEEEEPLPADLENIASSMQALARSIVNDEREVFGDRPRPRMNTGDFKR